MKSFSLLLSLCIAILPFLVIGQSTNLCNAPTTCPAVSAQVPLAWFNLTFSTPIANTSYGWNATDSTGCGHTGLAITGNVAGSSNGADASYIDLNNATGPSTSGKVLPGPMGPSTTAGSVAAGTAGWTYEVTANFQQQTTWAKIFSLGDGAGVSDIILGWNNGNLEIDFSVNSFNQTVTPINGYTNGGNIAVIPNPNVGLNQWYHIVVVVQQLEARPTFGMWFAYVNGNLTTSNAANNAYYNYNAFYAIPDAPRALSYLGRSSYSSDRIFSMELDTFRIYNTALNAAQVQSLYDAEMGGCPITVVANPVVVDAFPNTVSAATVVPAPYFGLNFSANPVQAGSDFSWTSVDEGDLSCNASLYHTGLLSLAGGADMSESLSIGQFVNLSAATGPNSVGSVMPIIGGVPSNANFSSGAVGWSFEFTFKPEAVETWAKMFDAGGLRTNGNCNNDFVLGWVGTSLRYMNMEICDVNGNGLSTVQFGPILASVILFDLQSIIIWRT